jgi:hypothetical protein
MLTDRVGTRYRVRSALLSLLTLGLLGAVHLAAAPVSPANTQPPPGASFLLRADTISAVAPDGTTRRYATLECQATLPGRTFRRVDVGETARIPAGPHALEVPAGRLSTRANVQLSVIGDGTRRAVDATVDPAGAVTGDLRLTLSYRGCPGAGNGSTLRIVNVTRGVELPGVVVDASNQSVTAGARDFSQFVLAEPLP